jgi:EAL domain-containing protein (putative c-di-GMP-specific phosphodiesterase class I)
MSRIRIVIADDEPVVRKALEQLIASEPTLRLVGVAADSDEVVDLAGRLQPDVALLDVRMPGGGPEAARGIRECSAYTKVIALSAYADRETVLEMIRSGAAGYLVKGAAGAEVLDTISRCARGESRLSGEITGDVVAELSDHLERAAAVDEIHRSQVERIQRVLGGNELGIVLQPIADLETGEVIGYEALSRFLEPTASPAEWFGDADTVGLRAELELHALRAALARLDSLPPSSFLSINISPDSLAFEPCRGLDADTCSRIVLELTEHAPVDDYDAVARALASARADGVRIAIDDVGAGFASLRHILHVAPEFIKLDSSLTHDVQDDPGRRAVAQAMITFATELRATIIAEGIETEEQLQTLRALGVRYGQGFYIARPSRFP